MGENSSCEADQRLCFRYSDITIPFLLTRYNIFIRKSIKDIINLKVNKNERKNDEQQMKMNMKTKLMINNAVDCVLTYFQSFKLLAIFCDCIGRFVFDLV